MAKKRSSALDALMLADLERSGLSATDAELLGLYTLDGPGVKRLDPAFEALGAMVIPYWSPENPSEPQTFKPKWPQFYRVRYLDKPNDFSAQTDGKSQRYVQPVDSGICAYWPRNVAWVDILKDTDRPIIITEGEKKAAKACKEGFATVGLGGVWSYRSAKHCLPLLPDLKRMNWARRNVYIVYDSDSHHNPMVNQALYALATELSQHGAMVYMATLPTLSNDDTAKVGLDDYLVAGGDLAALLHQAQPLTAVSALWDLNNAVVYVRDPGLIVERKDNARITVAAFKEHAYSSRPYVEWKLNKEGSPVMEPASVPASWLKWPHRAEAARLTYLPGREAEHDGEYNIWPGWGCEPKKGSVKPFLELIDHVFDGAPREDRDWFLRWLACPLQRPGVKMFSAAVIHGTFQGSGKSIIGLTMGRIYGENFSEISQSDLENSFNEWAVCKQFVLGDDVTGHDRRAYSDQLKKLITQKELRVNQKFVPSYVIPDCINYYFTSNQPDAFSIEDADRRYFVHEVTCPPLGQDFYDRYAEWLSGEGPSALFHYLLHYDLADFNPAAPARRTRAKELMTDDTKGDLAIWVTQLLRDPDTMLAVGGAKSTRDLYTNKELLTMYDPEMRTKVSANGLGRELRRAGVVQARGGALIRTESGLDRYYIIRNRATWIRAELPEIQAHLSGEKPKRKKKKY